jgi:hypothetical protein
MKNRLLNEQNTRRFMKLAGIKNLSENFIEEHDVTEEAVDENEEVTEMAHEKDENIEEAEHDGADEMEAPEELGAPEEAEGEVTGDTLADFLDFISSKVETYADEHNIDFDVEVEEEPEGDEAAMDMGDEDLDMGDEDLDMGDDDLGMGEEEPEMEEGEEDLSMEEDLVNEVARRVAQRLIKELKQ